MADLNRQMQDKQFVKSYFKGCEDGQAVNQKLMQDQATISAPDLIARLVQWLDEAEPEEEDEDAAIRTEQEMKALNLNSSQPSDESSSSESKEAAAEKSGGAGGESSDGVSGTSRQQSTSIQFGQPK